MKKWYLWLVLSLIFAIGGLLNYFDGRSIIASIIQVSITVILAFTQFLCDKNGEKGKKVFKYISIVVMLLLVACLGCLIFKFLIK